MPLRRVFLDWSEPCLPAVARWLLDGRDAAAGADLHTLMCVTPGRRAGRILLGLLLEEAARRGLHLTPPTLATPGDLAARLAPSVEPIATPTEVTFAWLEALREGDPATRAPLVAAPPAADDVMAWRTLAGTCARLDEELAGEERDFLAVADAADRMELPDEGDRWRALASLKEHARAALARAGLRDPAGAAHEAIERLGAAAQRADLTDLVMIGLTDLNARQRALVSAWPGAVTAIVHAPEQWGDRFDDLGCVKPEAWTDLPIEIDEHRIVIVDRHGDQAQAVLHAVAALEGRYGPDQITVGLGEESLASTVIHAGGWAGLSFHHAAGQPLSRSGPFRLLEAMTDWLEGGRFVEFATLLRHPDLEAWLRRVLEPEAGQSDTSPVAPWLSLMDRYMADHLQQRVVATWLAEPHAARRLRSVHDAVARLLAPLSGAGRPVGAWGEAILQVLAQVYGEPEDGVPAPRLMQRCGALALLRSVMQDLWSIDRGLQPTVDGATALRLVLAMASGQRIADDPRADQIEMLGWLELPLDPAPALIVTGIRDGVIPSAVGADAFLPDALRARLGLMSNARRYARDACALHTLLRSRERLTLIAGRLDAEGEPVTPSRLLLACSGPALVQRVERLCGRRATPAPQLPAGAPAPATRSRFIDPPRLDALEPPAKMNVTDFRAYLRCPYRYALERLLKLGPISDEALEMDALQFGSLAHTVLQRFGEDPELIDSTDAQQIEDFLLATLQTEASRQFGDDPLPAVRVQIARLGQRLRSFARQQAQWRAEGWIIRHAELAFRGTVALDIADQPPMPLHGKIDRLDQHEDHGAWRVIDYKTGESGKHPHEIHHGHGRNTRPRGDELDWADLQLPLYHFLVRQGLEGVQGALELGYIVLPRRSDSVQYRPAEWTAAQLESAIALAREIVAKIRAGSFPMSPTVGSGHDAFARICRTTVFESGADDEETT